MPRFPYALVCCWSRRAVTKKHWTNSTAAHWSPRGSKLSASLYQGRSLELPTNTTLSMLCMYHTIFQWINTVFSIFVAHLYFSPYAPDKVVGVYLRAMLCKNMVMVIVECMLDVCKLNVSLVCLHYNAKRYGGCLSWSWRILEEYLWYSKFFYGRKVTFLLPQETPGIHSMLNQFDSKDLLVYSQISFLLLFKWLPILIIGPGKVNIWEPDQAGQAWISITTLKLPIWAFYITEEEV